MEDYTRLNKTVSLDHFIGAEQNARVLRVTGKSMQEWNAVYEQRRRAHKKSRRLTPSKLMTEATMHQVARFYGFDASDFECVSGVPLSEFRVWEPGWVQQPCKEGRTATHVNAWRIKASTINAI